MNTDKTKEIIDESEEQAINNQEHEGWDHYHGVHHITKDGKHDHVENDEFKSHLQWKMTRSQLIFKMILTAMFLAICFVVSAIDMALEAIQLPVNDQLWIQFRFLDIALVCISIAILGPIFSSLIAFLAPWIHAIVHWFAHGFGTPSVEMLSNIVIVWMVWVVFYLIFQNSPIHKQTDKKKAAVQRFLSLPIMIILAALITTAFFILVLYVTQGGEHDHGHEGEHDHDEGIALSNINATVFFTILAWNILKYIVAFTLFSAIEWRMRPLNHRYAK